MRLQRLLMFFFHVLIVEARIGPSYKIPCVCVCVHIFVGACAHVYRPSTTLEVIHQTFHLLLLQDPQWPGTLK